MCEDDDWNDREQIELDEMAEAERIDEAVKDERERILSLIGMPIDEFERKLMDKENTKETRRVSESQKAKLSMNIKIIKDLDLKYDQRKELLRGFCKTKEVVIGDFENQGGETFIVLDDRIFFCSASEWGRIEVYEMMDFPSGNPSHRFSFGESIEVIE